MALMQRENANIRQQLHAKKTKRKRTYTTGKAQLMTSEEMMSALLDDLHKKQMGELHSELKKKHFPDIRAAICQVEKDGKAAAKKAEQAAKTATKEAEKAAKAAERRAKAAEKAAEKAAKAVEKAAARARGRGRGRARGRRTGGRGPRGSGRGRGMAPGSDEEEEFSPESSESDENTDIDVPVPNALPDPIPASSDEDSDFDEQVLDEDPIPSAIGRLPPMQDESDDEEDLAEEEKKLELCLSTGTDGSLAAIWSSRWCGQTGTSPGKPCPTSMTALRWRNIWRTVTLTTHCAYPGVNS
ncbi:hypothetical protein B0H14DRAFT_3786646 [Mycena olivaceomarginata]|nr:hypothetical protein B0H14DRAFT_3786646 [Mycena olivaceomarginata]